LKKLKLAESNEIINYTENRHILLVRVPFDAFFHADRETLADFRHGFHFPVRTGLAGGSESRSESR